MRFKVLAWDLGLCLQVCHAIWPCPAVVASAFSPGPVVPGLPMLKLHDISTHRVPCTLKTQPAEQNSKGLLQKQAATGPKSKTVQDAISVLTSWAILTKTGVVSAMGSPVLTLGVGLVMGANLHNLSPNSTRLEEAIAVLESGGTKLKQVAIIKKEQAITFGKQGVETVEQELKKLQLSHLPSSLHTLLLTFVKGLRQEVGQSLQTSVRHAVAATLQMHQHGARRGRETVQVCAKVSALLRHRAAELHRSALDKGGKACGACGNNFCFLQSYLARTSGPHLLWLRGGCSKVCLFASRACGAALHRARSCVVGGCAGGVQVFDIAFPSNGQVRRRAACATERLSLLRAQAVRCLISCLVKARLKQRVQAAVLFVTTGAACVASKSGRQVVCVVVGIQEHVVGIQEHVKTQTRRYTQMLAASLGSVSAQVSMVYSTHCLPVLSAGAAVLHDSAVHTSKAAHDTSQLLVRHCAACAGAAALAVSTHYVPAVEQVGAQALAQAMHTAARVQARVGGCAQAVARYDYHQVAYLATKAACNLQEQATVVVPAVLDKLVPSDGVWRVAVCGTVDSALLSCAALRHWWQALDKKGAVKKMVSAVPALLTVASMLSDSCGSAGVCPPVGETKTCSWCHLSVPATQHIFWCT
mmetsp:Transcript_49901/g.80496  ORF Transcript_49901/g.80496 Transcript_49901/m.80496 type:complete len:642 (+) Transcript_49901:56-1981(+)